VLFEVHERSVYRAPLCRGGLCNAGRAQRLTVDREAGLRWPRPAGPDLGS